MWLPSNWISLAKYMNVTLQTNISFVECCIVICYKMHVRLYFLKIFCAHVKLETKISMEIWETWMGLTNLSDVDNTVCVLIRVS
jgi:hypothetical protein